MQLSELQSKSKHERSRKSKSRQQAQAPNKKRSQFHGEFKDSEDDGQYDSTDSADQLLDENFTPSFSKPNHLKKRTNLTPKKSLVLFLDLSSSTQHSAPYYTPYIIPSPHIPPHPQYTPSPTTKSRQILWTFLVSEPLSSQIPQTRST